MKQTRVLCVDDEPQILKGLAQQLRHGYEVLTATSGAEGLEVLAQHGPFAVVLSDMRMPGMDGAAFLTRVLQQAPDTVRMLLTGYADLEAAIAAVNEGQVFRFLTKPCPPDQLRLSFEAASEQYRLVTSERVLLEQTLHGSIKTLTDVLALTNPVAYGRATRAKQHVSELADALGLQDRWQVEVAAMLSQLGSIILPEETAERLYYGQELSTEEEGMVTDMAKVTDELLANIPRLEEVREILAEQNTPFKAVGQAGRGKKDIPLGARLLRIAVDFDDLEARGFSMQLAVDTMCGREDCYDPEILQQFLRLKRAATGRQVREIPLQAVRVGMVLAEDVRSKTGMLLVARGYQVTPSFVERARNQWAGSVREPLRIVVDADER